MKQLELLGSSLFEAHASNKGTRADWNYLAKDRQLEWCKEALFNVTFIVDAVRSKLKPAPVIEPREATYNVAWKQGNQAKYIESILVLDSLKEELNKQLEELKVK